MHPHCQTVSIATRVNLGRILCEYRVLRGPLGIWLILSFGVGLGNIHIHAGQHSCGDEVRAAWRTHLRRLPHPRLKTGPRLSLEVARRAASTSAAAPILHRPRLLRLYASSTPQPGSVTCATPPMASGCASRAATSAAHATRHILRWAAGTPSTTLLQAQLAPVWSFSISCHTPATAMSVTTM